MEHARCDAMFGAFVDCDHRTPPELVMLTSESSHYVVLERMAAEVPPCLACGFARMCRDQKLACSLFEQFVDRGKLDRDEQRQPISKIYHSLFPDEGRGISRPWRPQRGHRHQALLTLNIHIPRRPHETTRTPKR
jgi:hypothetical protein